MSKRTGSLSVGELRERGIEALAIAALLARLGTADPVEPVTSLETLVATVDFARVGRAAARFSEDELAHLSARTLHLLPYAAVRDRLPPGVGEALWLAVRGNLTTFADASAWAESSPARSRRCSRIRRFSRRRRRRLPAEPWGETTWKEWTGAVSAATQRKGRALFHPLRLALTARETGPEMAKLLPLIGRTKAAARLRGQTA